MSNSNALFGKDGIGLTKTQIKVGIWLSISFVIGTILILPSLSNPPHFLNNLGVIPESEWMKVLLLTLGSSLYVSIIITICFEFVVKKNFKEDIKEAINKKDNPIVKKTDIDFTEERFDKFAAGDNIDIIGISLHGLFYSIPGKQVILNQVERGLNFRILFLSPDAGFTAAYNLEAENFETPFRNLESDIDSSIKCVGELRKMLGPKEIKGQIKIRTMTDVFSTISYQSSPLGLFVGTYFSHQEGLNCTRMRVEIGSEHYKQCRDHFEHIWSKNSGNNLLG